MWEIITKTAAWVSLMFLAIGLYQPWYVLWWRATQNRKMVISLYGTISLIFFLLYNIIKF